jgi:hypothetical protein
MIIAELQSTSKSKIYIDYIWRVANDTKMIEHTANTIVRHNVMTYNEIAALFNKIGKSDLDTIISMIRKEEPEYGMQIVNLIINRSGFVPGDVLKEVFDNPKVVILLFGLIRTVIYKGDKPSTKR